MFGSGGYLVVMLQSAYHFDAQFGNEIGRFTVDFLITSPALVAAYIEDGKETFLPAGTPVSMNLWAFRRSVLDELESRFPAWLDENIPLNPMKCEYFLPLIPNALIREGRGTVRVLTTDERWFGVTYHDDLAAVQTAVAAMKREGRYPEKLWEK